MIELAPMDNQRRLSQEQLQHAQQIAARNLVHSLAHEIKIRSVACAVQPNYWLRRCPIQR